jgi:hypothetical protein
VGYLAKSSPCGVLDVTTIAECAEQAPYCEWYAANTQDERDRKFLLRKAGDWKRLAAKEELDIRWAAAKTAA